MIKKAPLLLIFTPLIVLALIGIFVILPFWVYVKELIAFTCTSIICASTLVILPKILKKSMLFFFMFILYTLIFIKLSFYLNYGARLNASTLYAVFETNERESLEYLSSYFNNQTNLLLATVLGCFCVVVFFARSLNVHYNYNKYFKWMSIGVIVLSGILLLNKFHYYNLILTSANSYQEYSEVKKLINSELSTPKSKNLVVDINRDEQTFVVIIGESTTKWHMGLYGYYRNTNPELAKLKENLYIFNNVISPNVNTIVSLDKILTFSDFHNPNRGGNTSLVQMANMAGFETYWVSNQHVHGLNQSFAAEIAYASNYSYFLAMDHYHFSTSYDEVVLQKFENIINTKTKKKLIFLHLIGTHIRYSDRYPKSFNVFKSKEQELDKDVDMEKESIIDHYDNAVLYNDHIVSEVIKKISKQPTKSTVVYFSDHGDDVYDVNQNIFGHSEDNATPPMYEVPFLLWFSKQNPKRTKDSILRSYTNRKYNLEDFEHTFSDLLGVSHNLFEPSKSIVNDKFKEKNRLIKDGVDYDVYKAKK